MSSNFEKSHKITPHPAMKTHPTHSKTEVTTVLLLENVRFSHAKLGQASALSPLFQHLSAQIPSGVTWVQGGEDRGKTTLLRLLAGELRAQAGTLSINGISFKDQPAAYQAQVFWVAPRSEAFDPLIVADFFASVQHRYPRFDAQLLAELVEGLSLAEHLNKALYMLSAGSKRKVWLAAAFASGAAVTLLDEPFAALDMASIRVVTELLADAAEHNQRAWVIADYEAPSGLPLAGVIDLGD
jgi:ABC-type multidrug transport system ATPase subunit